MWSSSSVSVIAIVAFVWMLIRDRLEPIADRLPECSFRYQLFEWSGATFLVVVSGLLGMFLYRHPIAPSARTPAGELTKGRGDE